MKNLKKIEKLLLSWNSRNMVPKCYPASNTEKEVVEKNLLISIINNIEMNSINIA